MASFEMTVERARVLHLLENWCLADITSVRQSKTRLILLASEMLKEFPTIDSFSRHRGLITDAIVASYTEAERALVLTSFDRKSRGVVESPEVSSAKKYQAKLNHRTDVYLGRLRQAMFGSGEIGQ